MTGSMGADEASDQAPNRRGSVRPPGAGLVAQISDLATAGRPVWRLGHSTPRTGAHAQRDLLVPRLPVLIQRAHDGSRTMGPGPMYAVDVLGSQPRLARVLDLMTAEVPYVPAFEDLTRNDRTLWRDLVAATLHDLYTLRGDPLAEHCGLGSDRKVREALADGREVLSALGAWPWWCFGPQGVPGRPWRSSALRQPHELAFETWATGTLRLAAMRVAADFAA